MSESRDGETAAGSARVFFINTIYQVTQETPILQADKRFFLALCIHHKQFRLPA